VIPSGVFDLLTEFLNAEDLISLKITCSENKRITSATIANNIIRKGCKKSEVDYLIYEITRKKAKKSLILKTPNQEYKKDMGGDDFEKWRINVILALKKFVELQKYLTEVTYEGELDVLVGLIKEIGIGRMYGSKGFSPEVESLLLEHIIKNCINYTGGTIVLYVNKFL
jgi:hypothetical protein